MNVAHARCLAGARCFAASVCGLWALLYASYFKPLFVMLYAEESPFMRPGLLVLCLPGGWVMVVYFEYVATLR